MAFGNGRNCAGASAGRLGRQPCHIGGMDGPATATDAIASFRPRAPWWGGDLQTLRNPSIARLHGLAGRQNIRRVRTYGRCHCGPVVRRCASTCAAPAPLLAAKLRSARHRVYPPTLRCAHDMETAIPRRREIVTGFHKINFRKLARLTENISAHTILFCISDCNEKFSSVREMTLFLCREHSELTGLCTR